MRTDVTEADHVLLGRILPEGVASAELFTDPPGLGPHPAEEPLISRAVDKRRREFVGARHCARVALAELGLPQGPIMRGDKGSPRWPRGVVGSLTHCEGYRGAALAHALAFRSIGIDAEPHAPLPEGVLDAVSLRAERTRIAALAAEDLHLDRVLFCAKEATYKAWFPLTHRWLGFEDAHITFTVEPDRRSGSFRSELLVPGHTLVGAPLDALHGRWLVAGGLVLTTIVVG